MSLIDKVAHELSAHIYRFRRETDLHEGMGWVLAQAGIAFEREVVAGPRERFDFLLEGGLVIEVKVNGSLADALLQCKRYADRTDVTAIVLAATRHWANRAEPVLTVSGKPVRLVKLKGASF